MGKRGPQPTPTLKLLERGSRRGKARQKAGEPLLEVSAPPCPEWLSERAQSYWPDVVDIGLAMNVITNSDRLGMALLCDALADWVEASASVEEEGMVTSSEKGTPFQHPMVGIKNQAWKRVAQMLAAFGMTPADRSRVQQVKDAKKANPLQQILSRRGQA